MLAYNESVLQRFGVEASGPRDLESALLVFLVGLRMEARMRLQTGCMECNNVGMSVAEETAAVVDILPPGKAQSVLDFAKYLAEQEEEAAWERSFAKAKNSEKFNSLVNEVRQEIDSGKDAPMDMDRL